MRETASAPDDAKRVTMQVSTVGIVCNAALTVFKLVAGIVAHSSAIVADAVHSASDILGSLIVMIGAIFSNKAADASHPYGHEKLECIASILLGNILVLVGAAIGYTGITKIIHGETLAAPGMLALIAAVVSIVVKEALYWYTIAAAKRIRSVSLKAEAWHHRSDALSSIGSFAGVLGARLGLPILDPIASIVVSSTARLTPTPSPPCAGRCCAPPVSCAWTISRRGCSAAGRMSMPRSRSTVRCRCATRTPSQSACTMSSSTISRTSSTAPCTSTPRKTRGDRAKKRIYTARRAALSGGSSCRFACLCALSACLTRKTRANFVLRYAKNSHPARICRLGNHVRQGSTQASEAGLHNVNRHRARGPKNIGVTELPP